MNIGLLLALGDSFEAMSKTGQDIQFKNIYLKSYSKNFKKVFIFSYSKEIPVGLPGNVIVLPNKYNIHRYIYAFILPIIYRRQIKNISVFRAYHLSGTAPAIIMKILYGKNFVFNYAYNYKKFAIIEKKPLQYLFNFIIEPLAYLFTKKIFVANEKYLKISRKALFLPNGVNIFMFKPKKINKQKNIKKILSVGRLEHQKNYSLLLKSLNGINVNLTIVGTGPQKDNLLKEARENNININIINSVPYNKLPAIYNASDIFILSSKIEGHPKVLLEAMASGLPVICTKVEGAREIIKNGLNGLLVENNSQSIRRQIINLISNLRLRKILSVSARRTIVENFDLKKLLIIEINTIKHLI